VALLLTLVTALVPALSACSGNSASKAGSGIYGLDVSGSVGTEPVVRMAAPLAVEKTRTQVVITGSGAPIQVDQLFVLQLTLYDARTGKRVDSTYGAGEIPLVVKSSDDSLFPALTQTLLGKRQGSRVVVALTGTDAYGSGAAPPPGVRASDAVVVVADIAAVPPADVLTRADGSPVAPPSGAPEVAVTAGDPTGVDVAAGSTPPSKLDVIALITGTGPKVRDHSLVTVDYLGQVWGSRGAFVDTYFKEPAVVPIGATGSMAAWDEALVGLPRGSRVLIIDPNPPSREPGVVRAPGHGTIAWVIDVLGVS
jgi:peptidylprolyl isomerase